MSNSTTTSPNIGPRPFNYPILPKIGLLDMNKQMPDMTPFMQSAIFFQKNKHYPFYNIRNKKRPDTSPDSPFRRHWDEERRRCREGMWHGGEYITGELYHYLNYGTMWKLPKLTEEESKKIKAGGTIKKVRFFGQPNPWDSTYHISNYFEEAWRQGRHVTILKSRGLGLSYWLACCATNVYFHGKGEKVFVLGPDEKALTNSDSILARTWLQMDFEDKYTPFFKIREGGKSDTVMMRRAKKVSRKRGAQAEGTDGSSASSIEGRIARGSIDFRGSRGRYIIIDEGGINKNIIDIVNVARRSVEQNNITYGQIVIVGTGGSKVEDLAGFSTIIRNPKNYKVLGVPDVFSKVFADKQIALFMGSYWNNSGFYTDGGVSDIMGAYKHEMDIRKEMAESDGEGSVTYSQYVAENCLHPEEALINVGTSKMPMTLIYNRIRELENRRHNYEHGMFNITNMDNPVFMPGIGFPIHEFPITSMNDKSGSVCIIEEPVPGKSYFGGADPYSNDTAEKGSLGAIYIMDELKDKIVAFYVGRPNQNTDFTKISIALQRKYNDAQVLMENVTGGPISYYRLLNAYNLLMAKPTIVKAMLPKSRAATDVGMHKVQKVFNDTLNFLIDWLTSPSIEDPEILNINTLEDLGLLRELALAAEKLNFDRLNAVSMLFLARQERLMLAAIGKNRSETPNQRVHQIKKHLQQFNEDFRIKNFNSNSPGVQTSDETGEVDEAEIGEVSGG